MLYGNYIFARFFSEESHVECFRSGILRMLSLKHYKLFDDTDYDPINLLYNDRFDLIENSVSVHNPDMDGNIKTTFPFKYGKEGKSANDVWLNPKCSFSPLMVSNEELDIVTKVCCLYSIFQGNLQSNKLSSTLSAKVANFGEYYCIITDVNKFLARVCSKFEIKDKLTINEKCGFITYVNEKEHNGYYGPFRKPSDQSWQNEFRIKVETTIHEPFEFIVDDLHDITIYGRTEDLLNGKLTKDGILTVKISKK